MHQGPPVNSSRVDWIGLSEFGKGRNVGCPSGMLPEQSLPGWPLGAHWALGSHSVLPRCCWGAVGFLQLTPHSHRVRERNVTSA